MESYTFRLAGPHDIDDLVTLRLLMQKEVNDVLDTDIPPDYKEDVKRYFERTISEKSYLSSIAEIDGKTVAAAGLVVYEKPPSLSGPKGRMGFVTNVYTRKEWRGKGISTEVMKLLIREAQSFGVEKLQLGTTADGQGVYERVGFKPVKFPALEMKLV